MSENKDITSRHLQHKLQSLGRRLDELEEATNKLQKSEDELLDLQDKIIQAEGSNSSMLGDVEGLRKRLLKIEGKDEEVCKAEDLCRMVREKLEEEESLTQDLKSEIECLQRRMAELEKLEEAFSKSKSDCSQLCLSLNEEKNLTRKLSSEMEALKDRVKEVDTSEVRLDRAEMFLAGELEKLKGLTQTFLSERKRLLEKQKEDEKLILKLTEKLERQNRIDPVDPRRIEDDLSSGLTGKLGRKKSLDYLKLGDDFGLRNKSENEKNRLDGQDDNKVKELTQEVERLKNRLKQLELVEEDLKNTESKNGELQEKFQQERSRSRALNDQGSSTRSSIDEEQHRLLVAEGESLEPTHTPSGIELRRVCSPREALRSKAVIKPAIVEIDRKEVMISGGAEPLTSSNGKPKISTKPVLTSSITIYPNDPNSSRTSSRSSSVSSEPPVKERHTSTSNIVIGPSEHRGSISIPYEISIPKREITPWPSMDGPDESGVLGMACAETHLLPRSNFSLQSPETTSDFNNDTESGFESSSSSTTTVTSWRSQHHGHHTSQDDSLPEMRNVTVRSTWKNRGAASVDEPGRGARMYGMGSEDEAESATTWRAYRATTILDTEETVNATRAATSRTAKPSPAELYMRRINNSVVTTREIAEPVCRSKSSLSPTDGGLRMSIPHEPVSSQKLVPWRTQPMAADDTDPNPGSWRTRTAPGDLDPYESERSSRTDVGSSRGMRTTASRPALLSNRGHAGLAEGRTGRGNQQWSNRQTDD
ncbi:unnamed protein product [Oncorhynchus mykiss]|uniref:Leucine zipper protein 1 n=1 Tax=Oncorhynchus mykiss TaxID=8022 RepID=A0A060X491_ONCMY|nr:unnamed protein product [Oncorhynchus mykiss]